MSLNTSALNGSPLFHRDSNDNCPIITEFPKQIKCLILHQRFMINQYAISLLNDGNVCVECTCIRDDFEILANENKILFEPFTIITYVLSPSTLVVNQL